MGLAPALQEAIIAGEFGPVSEHKLRSILKQDAATQRKALERYAKDEANQTTAHPMRPRKLRVTQTYPLRRIAYFNPSMFVAKRVRGQTRRRRFETWLTELNKELKNPYSRRDEQGIHFLVMEKLSTLKWIRMYEYALEQHQRQDGTTYWQVAATLNQAEWERRQRYHGFVLLVASADLPQSATELAILYRAKDTIERDFRLIKDVVELRPIYHYTDPKVRAHVTLCMLALLIQRLIEAQLGAAGISMTASRCLALLGQCHLNALERHELLNWMYSITRTTPEQKQLLRALGLKNLADERSMAKVLVPRPNTLGGA